MAAWMGVAAPRTAVATVPRELSPRGYVAPPGVAGRARALAIATAADLQALGRVRGLSLGILALVALAALGATKRAFSGFDASTFVGPVLFLGWIYAAHLWALERPFSLSALDDASRQGARLVVLGAVCAALAIAVAAVAARRSPRSFVVPLRRGAAAIGWVAIVQAAGLVAWVGESLGPWPVSGFAAYAPTFGLATGAGAAAIAAVVLGISALFADRALEPSG